MIYSALVQSGQVLSKILSTYLIVALLISVYLMDMPTNCNALSIKSFTDFGAKITCDHLRRIIISINRYRQKLQRKRLALFGTDFRSKRKSFKFCESGFLKAIKKTSKEKQDQIIMKTSYVRLQGSSQNFDSFNLFNAQFYDSIFKD